MSTPQDDYSPNRGAVRFKFNESDDESYVLRYNWRAIDDIERDLDISFANIVDEDGNMDIRMGAMANIIYHGLKQQHPDLEKEDVFERMDMHNFNSQVMPAFLEAFNASQPPEDVMEDREDDMKAGNPTAPSQNPDNETETE